MLSFSQIILKGNNTMKIIILLMLVMVQFGCSISPVKEGYAQEVYPTNMNDCEPVTDNEDYINIDCKRRSVNTLMDEVKYMNEPALVTLQGYSMMTSGIEICTNLTNEDVVTMNKELESIYKMVAGLYEFDKNPEAKKEIDLVNKILKGKFESKIKKEDCKDLKDIAEQEQKYSQKSI
jgi:hypothetical protein